VDTSKHVMIRTTQHTRRTMVTIIFLLHSIHFSFFATTWNWPACLFNTSTLFEFKQELITSESRGLLPVLDVLKLFLAIEKLSQIGQLDFFHLINLFIEVNKAQNVAIHNFTLYCNSFSLSTFSCERLVLKIYVGIWFVQLTGWLLKVSWIQRQWDKSRNKVFKLPFALQWNLQSEWCPLCHDTHGPRTHF